MIDTLATAVGTSLWDNTRQIESISGVRQPAADDGNLEQSKVCLGGRLTFRSVVGEPIEADG